MTAPAPEPMNDLLMFVRLSHDGWEEWTPVTKEQLEGNDELVIDGRPSKIQRYKDMRRKLSGRGVRPGTAFAVTLTPEGVRFARRSSPVGFYANEDRVVEWAAQTKAVERDARARHGLAKESTRKLHLERLEPMRRAYQRLSGSAKAQLVAEVVAYIVN